jgi:hypothetical protein
MVSAPPGKVASPLLASANTSSHRPAGNRRTMRAPSSSASEGAGPGASCVGRACARFSRPRSAIAARVTTSRSLRAFAGFVRKVIDQRFLAAGEPGRAALGIGIAVDQLGVFDQTGLQPAGPAQPRRQRLTGFDQQRAFLTDSGFDQPLSQGGTPQL